MTEDLVLGIVADETLQRRDLQAFADHFAYKVAVSCSPQQWLSTLQDPLFTVNCWLIDADLDEEDYPELMQYLDKCEASVIYGIEKFSQVQETREHEFRRLQPKVIFALDEQVDNKCEDKAPEVWVLGASLGGPEAVKEFIDQMPEAINVIFLYAQHLDEVGSKALVDVLGRDSEVPIQAMRDITRLSPGIMYTVPIDSVIDFSKHFAFKVRRPWLGAYKPSINELLTVAHNQFDDRLNVIFFSGMGEDGADKAKKMKARNAQVWAQSPESSVSSAMPLSVIEQDICQHVASPAELARTLVARIKAQEH